MNSEHSKNCVSFSCRKPKSQEGNKSFVPEPRVVSVSCFFDSYAYEHFMHVNVFTYRYILHICILVLS